MGELKDANWYDMAYSLNTDKKGDYTKKPKDTFYYPLWLKAVKFCGKKIFDIGCGPGQFGLLCLGLRKDYYGIDFSPVAIRMARKMTKSPSRFKVVDITKDVFVIPQGSTVVMLEFLEHIEDDLGLLKKLPTGIQVVFSVPSQDYKSHVRTFQSMEEVINRYSDHVRIETIEEIYPGKPRQIFLCQGYIR